MERTEVLANLRGEIDAGRYIIAAGCGTGLSAKCSEAGGCDLIFIYNTARYRMAGRGSLAGLLPFGDANALTLEMAEEVVPVLKKAPVIGGICGTDPFRVMPAYLEQLKTLGVVGIMNWPSVGLIDGVFRENLEGTGMGLGLEVDVIRQAHDLDMVTAPFGYDAATTRDMAEAGADIIVTHMGLTVSGTIGAVNARPLDGAVEGVQEIADAAHEVNPDIFVLCHGGPIATVDDASYVLENTTGVHGFLGGSAMERLPAEKAQTETARAYKEISPATA